MRYRLIISLIISITLVAFLFAYFQVRSEKRVLRNDLERRAEVLGESLLESVEPLLESQSWSDLQRLLNRFDNREGLTGVAVYGKEGQQIASASVVQVRFDTAPPAIRMAITQDKGISQFLTVHGIPLEVYALPIHGNQGMEGALALYHNAAFIQAQSSRLWRDTFVRLLVETFLIALISLLIIRVSILEPVTKTAQWLRAMRTGKGPRGAPPPAGELFQPIAQEVNQWVKTLEVARTAAEEEALLREAGDTIWTAERLRLHVRNRFKDKPLFAVSNREPYMHVRKQSNGIKCRVPPSGLVTALEPVLRACDGTWVATGAGNADREVVDKRDRLRVPPGEPHYTLRRVWLTTEEMQGFYLGFANEGLWPLCHIAHMRPIFREADWKQYRAVNEKFAKALLEEMEGTEEPAVLIHDYHFALLPRLVKEKRPDVRVAIFWHIPWPNAEAFGICPWQRELLDGLLGADLAAFHIQSHCNNFLESVDRTLECRIEWDRFTVNRRGHFTMVRPFPVGVVFNRDNDKEVFAAGPSARELFKQLGVDASLMGIGVDRMDYTKGILERFRGIERFFEKYPAYQRKFSFAQIGAPSRTDIQSYRELVSNIENEAQRINARFQKGSWKPIVLLTRHHSHEEIARYYKAADLCMVTSLHDGMNLVAKEYVASRNDGQGALILSRFTGACRELRDALIVNPYDTEQLAEAIRFALEMDAEERNLRMQRMRRVVREHNIYRWAASLLGELSDLRLDRSESIKVR
jgi:trehalose-6-phosphate synthase/uncharacterized membrane protein affecting hemolysin expression